eukprot:403376894
MLKIHSLINSQINKTTISSLVILKTHISSIMVTATLNTHNNNFRINITIVSFKPSENWNYDEDDDEEDDDQEIGLQKSSSNKHKSLNSQDMQRNINQILDEEDDYIVDNNQENSRQDPQNIYNNAKHMGYRHDGQQNIHDHDFSEQNLPPRGQGSGERRERFQRPQREQFVPRPRFDEANVDMESNFRKYYFKDRQFYMKVIDQEDIGERGYKFKIHIFQISEDPEIVKEQEKRVFLTLSEMFARDIKSTVLPDKIRFFCTVVEKEDAKILYSKLHENLDPPLKSSMFLDFPEDLFVKYADLEAKKYEEYIEEQKKQRELQRKQQDEEYERNQQQRNYRNHADDRNYQNDNRNYDNRGGMRGGDKQFDDRYDNRQNQRGFDNQRQGQNKYPNTRVFNNDDDQGTFDNRRGGKPYQQNYRDNQNYHDRNEKQPHYLQQHDDREEIHKPYQGKGQNNNQNYNQDRSYQQPNRVDTRGGYQQNKFDSRRDDNNYDQRKVIQEPQLSKHDSAEYQINFAKGKPKFSKNHQQNLEGEDHRRVIDTTKNDQDAGVRTVIDSKNQRQVRDQYDYDNSRNSDFRKESHHSNTGSGHHQQRQHQNQFDNDSYQGQGSSRGGQNQSYNQGRGGYQGGRDNQQYTQGNRNHDSFDYRGGRGGYNQSGRGGMNLQKRDSHYENEERSQISDNASHHSQKVDSYSSKPLYNKPPRTNARDTDTIRNPNYQHDKKPYYQKNYSNNFDNDEGYNNTRNFDNNQQQQRSYTNANQGYNTYNNSNNQRGGRGGYQQRR